MVSCALFYYFVTCFHALLHEVMSYEKQIWRPTNEVVNNIIDWFNAANNSKFAPTIEEKLFGITSGPYEKELLKKFNYTILFMKYYIYTSKMQNQAIHLSVFVN